MTTLVNRHGRRAEARAGTATGFIARRWPNAVNFESERLSAGAVGQGPRESEWNMMPRLAKSWAPFAAVIFGFWGIWYVFYTAYGFINSPDQASALIFPRSLIAIAGIILSVGVAFALHRLRSRPLALRALRRPPLRSRHDDRPLVLRRLDLGGILSRRQDDLSLLHRLRQQLHRPVLVLRIDFSDDPGLVLRRGHTRA